MTEKKMGGFVLSDILVRILTQSGIKIIITDDGNVITLPSTNTQGGKDI